MRMHMVHGRQSLTHVIILLKQNVAIVVNSLPHIYDNVEQLSFQKRH